MALRLVGAATAAVLAVLWASTGAASAAVELGTLPPAGPEELGCGGISLVQQSTDPSGLYEVPPPGGVITGWAHKGDDDSDGGFGRLQVWRPAGGTNFTLVGRSELQPAVPGILNEFAARIAVAPGDLLGLWAATPEFGCYYMTGVPADVTRCCEGGLPTDPVPGDTRSLEDDDAGLRLNVTATLEPDADGDGFGDETQEQCATDASLQGPCADTTIVTGPRNKIKTKKKKVAVIFGFSSNVPAATFECKLDAGPFGPCASPDRERVKKGKHTFAVRAVSPGGVPDSSPATDAWKVKRKRKK